MIEFLKWTFGMLLLVIAVVTSTDDTREDELYD